MTIIGVSLRARWKVVLWIYGMPTSCSVARGLSMSLVHLCCHSLLIFWNKRCPDFQDVQAFRGHQGPAV